MKSINPTEDYFNLHRNDATILNSSDDFRNDLGQRITFFEDPTLGEDGPVWVAFSDDKVAFRSSFFDTQDMTGKIHNIMTPAEAIKLGLDGSSDLDYVPRYVDSKFFLKFEE